MLSSSSPSIFHNGFLLPAQLIPPDCSFFILSCLFKIRFACLFVYQMFGADITAALSYGDKHVRGAAVGAVEERVMQRFVHANAPIRSILSTGMCS